jgi:tRNA uridine 5-carbamoylmethylation protein Kti12
MSKLKNNIDKGVTEFYLNLDVDIIKESLKDDGVDVIKEDEKISKFSKRIKFMNKAIVIKEKTDNLLETIVSKFQEAIENNIDKPIASLKKLIEAKELSVQFRNLDKLTEEEIKEIIKGKNLVDLMDESDGETD